LILAATANASPPEFREVYGLVRSNLAGVDQAQLDEAAISGLLNEFPGRVAVVDAGASSETPAASKPLAKASVFDGSFAYFRVAEVSGDLPAELRQAWQALVETNKGKIKGVVLDLRFAGGADYTAAGLTADCFLATGQPLLEWPGGSVASSNKDNAISAPVTILVNAKTSGAAEALAAVLRATDRALTVGTKTAGQASVFKEFPLSTGQKVRVATAEVRIAGGPTLTDGLTPDIPVETTLEDDKAYMDDPYKQLHSSDTAHNAGQTNISEVATNEPEPRFNEAELVREHREGLNPGEGMLSSPAQSNETGAPIVADPSLARALDVLKGLAVINGGKPG
jgi:hypothetical protein